MELSQKMIPFPTASDEDGGAECSDSGDVDDEREHGIDGDYGSPAEYEEEGEDASDGDGEGDRDHSDGSEMNEDD